MRKVLLIGELGPYTGQVCKQTVYSWIRRGTFPRPVHMGRNRVAWLADEVEQWQSARIAERDAQQARTEAQS